MNDFKDLIHNLKKHFKRNFAQVTFELKRFYLLEIIFMPNQFFSLVFFLMYLYIFYKANHRIIYYILGGLSRILKLRVWKFLRII